MKLRTDLSPDEIPKEWYNILPDLPSPMPAYKNVETGKDVTELPRAYTKAASELEFSDQRWIKIPELVVDAYINCGRPTPLMRAERLEKFLKTPARIYYKCEDLPPSGTFKTNTAIPQAYWAMEEGFKRTIFGTGVATRTKFGFLFASNLFNLKPTLFITRSDLQHNNEQVFFLEKMFGADLQGSPSSRTETGRKLLAENPNHPGSRDTVGREVLEEIMKSNDAVTLTSSFLNHVIITQSIVGLELQKQLQSIGEKPNVLVASVGSGSNISGLITPFVRDFFKKKLEDIKFLGAESETSCKLTRGKYEYVTRQGPLSQISIKAYQYQWPGEPFRIKGQGIQTVNTAPILSFLRHLGIVESRAYPKDEKAVLEASRIFLQTEGRLLPLPSAYAIRAAIDEALEAKKNGEKKVIVASLSATTFTDFGEKSAYASLA